MENFTEFKLCFKVEIYQFSTKKKFVSNDSFSTYEEAWKYGEEESSQFGSCGFHVIECADPVLEFDIDVSSPCYGCEPNYIDACRFCRFASPDINESLRYSDEG